MVGQIVRPMVAPSRRSLIPRIDHHGVVCTPTKGEDVRSKGFSTDARPEGKLWMIYEEMTSNQIIA
jgi:hypothetical protein